MEGMIEKPWKPLKVLTHHQQTNFHSGWISARIWIFDGIWLNSNETVAGRGIMLRQSIVMIWSSAICSNSTVLLCIAAALLMRALKHTEPINDRAKACRELSTRSFRRPLTRILCAICRNFHSASNTQGLPPPHIFQLKSSWEPSLTHSSVQKLQLQKAWYFCKGHTEGEVER